MTRKKRRSRKGATVVADLVAVRASLEAPTHLAAYLARQMGAEVISERPGRIVSALADGTLVQVTIREVNVFRSEAEAYRRIGEPVPERVLRDIERWDREHGIG